MRSNLRVKGRYANNRQWYDSKKIYAYVFIGFLLLSKVSEKSIAIGAWVNEVRNPQPVEMFRQPETLLKVEQAQAKEIETPKVPAPQGSKEEKKEYIRQVFGEVEGNKAIKMLETCENSTLGQERTNKNRNGTVDYGVFQVNSVHEKKHGPAFKTDWKANVQVAKAIHDDWKGFGAWTCGYAIGEKTYLNNLRGE